MTALFGMPFDAVVSLVADVPRPVGVHAKVAAIRKARLEVEATRNDGDTFAYADSDDVFAQVNPLLEEHGLIVELRSADPPAVTMGNGKTLAIVTLGVALVDIHAEHDSPDREISSVWVSEAWLDPEGERGGIAAAKTSALKGWYVHMFGVKVTGRKLATGKVYKVAGSRKVTPPQIKNFIGQAQKEAGLTGEQVLALANDICDETIDGLAMLPADAADDLVDRIKAVGARERAKARETAGASS